ncbi:MAG TPA: hypothetical protein VG184_07960, partial [Acidimicrobiales bacterium]|nr:hypothetical protein [Acidimicrobiales bacterium]
GGHQPSPAGSGGHQPSPAGSGGHQPSPAGSGGHQPSPAGSGGHQHGTADCRWTPCYDCGACTGYGLEHVVASAVPPAGGSQGTGQDLSAAASVPVVLGRPTPVGSR